MFAHSDTWREALQAFRDIALAGITLAGIYFGYLAIKLRVQAEREAIGYQATKLRVEAERQATESKKKEDRDAAG